MHANLPDTVPSSARKAHEVPRKLRVVDPPLRAVRISVRAERIGVHVRVEGRHAGHSIGRDDIGLAATFAPVLVHDRDLGRDAHLARHDARVQTYGLLDDRIQVGKAVDLREEDVARVGHRDHQLFSQLSHLVRIGEELVQATCQSVCCVSFTQD